MISPDESILICAVRYAIGMECDERTWKNLLEVLKGEV